MTLEGHTLFDFGLGFVWIICFCGVLGRLFGQVTMDALRGFKYDNGFRMDGHEAAMHTDTYYYLRNV